MHSRAILAIRAAAALFALCAIAVPTRSTSQEIPPAGVDSTLLSAPIGVSQQSTGPDISSLAAQSAQLTAGPLLDAPVSRTEYVLGPGDVLTLAIFGDYSQLVNLGVNPEGSLLIPRMGIVPVLGLNLEQAEARVRGVVARYYRNVGVSLTLGQVRTFKVFVVGDVATPGVRTASAATRVSEVVADAPDTGVRRRNVHLKRASGDSVNVDLVRFLQVGDLSANPMLREGDAVVVPSIDRVVEVFGRVQFPGRYEFRSGETLAEFLAVANGGNQFRADAADTIRVTRFLDTQERRVHVFSRAEALGPTGRGFVLQPFDAVFVPALGNYMEQRTATVLGQVVRPGTYPIEPSVTTVRDLVRMAGGFTPEASLAEATLYRRPAGSESRALQRLQATPPEALSPEEQRILRIGAQPGESNVVVDFVKLFAEGNATYDQVIQSGDTLAVPRQRNEVMVLGAVAEPGIVRYEPGLTLAHYITLAGGYGQRADPSDVVVLKTKLGTRVHWRDAQVIEPGDRIVVPFRERIPFLQRVQTTQGIISTISGFVLTVIGIRQLF
jgi:protein involved in polysaccharide export with SLBB domain